MQVLWGCWLSRCMGICQPHGLHRQRIQMQQNLHEAGCQRNGVSLVHSGTVWHILKWKFWPGITCNFNCIWFVVDHFYIALFPILELIHCTLVVFVNKWKQLTIAYFLMCAQVVYLQHYLPHETAATRTHSVYTIQPCTSLQRHFMQSHIHRVHVCLAVTCHLHFWRNDQDLLCATAVTQGWNGYRCESQHWKLTLEMKILPPELKPMTFQ